MNTVSMMAIDEATMLCAHARAWRDYTSADSRRARPPLSALSLRACTSMRELRTDDSRLLESVVSSLSSPKY